MGSELGNIFRGPACLTGEIADSVEYAAMVRHVFCFMLNFEFWLNILNGKCVTSPL